MHWCIQLKSGPLLNEYNMYWLIKRIEFISFFDKKIRVQIIGTIKILSQAIYPDISLLVSRLLFILD